ncbi:2818_t:CDS:1 [Paraglomus occultum]|uniref:6,7-dimethyl-8-ribityllumazine synthase n=1 Tax=Paraglomus occultum TaxID=144539 RepID=A0A9N8VRF7_9GLOM|nr:2818_t:CDS:1 [Paraglomus occultum]
MESFTKGVKAPTEQYDGSKLRVLIVKTRWNSEIVDSLVEGAINSLTSYKVERSNIHIEDVAGSYELPFAIQTILCNRVYNKFDVAIAIGVLIKGDTMHFEYIAEAVSHGLMRVGLDTSTPVVFGVLTCLSETQALQRAGIGENSHNHGNDWGQCAVEMGMKRERWSKGV